MKNSNFSESYFTNRHGNDEKRQKSFLQEKSYIENLFPSTDLSQLKVLDIGCSTGEFIKAVFPNNKKVYGIEPSEFASSIANSNGIKILKSISEIDGIDLIVYRGTIQYIPNPFKSIEESFYSLNSGGKIIFLATPNTRSLYYLLFKDLPFLEDEYMYWVPSDSCIIRTLRNIGFHNIDVRYPYIYSPYVNPIKDLLKFIFKLITRKGRFPFPGNMIWVSASKN